MARSLVGSASLFSRSYNNNAYKLIKSIHVTSSAVAMTTTTTTTTPHPSLEILGDASNRFLHALPYLSRPYHSSPLLASNRHLETIFAAFFRSVPDVKLRRQCLRTQDGGSVALDWVSGDDRLLPPDSPLLILLPGLTGGSEDAYVRHMLVRARSKGWRVVVFNSRGCGDSPVTTPQFYSASFLGDMREVVSHVTARYPNANVYAVGWSLGANILVRYLGQESHNCPLSGAVSLCNPFNLVVADEDFRKGFNKIYGMLYYSKILMAANDPIAPYRGIPREDIKENPNCLLIVTPKGGHLGWVAGDEAPLGAPWTDPLVIEFIQYLEREAVKGPETYSNPGGKEALYHLEV